jgi:uncharacterized protein YjbJ (UPF0337 family)
MQRRPATPRPGSYREFATVFRRFLMWSATPIAIGTANAFPSSQSNEPKRPPRSTTMNWDEITGNWKQLKGKIKERWGKLTDDDLLTVEGKHEQLAGLLQKNYGYEKEQAQKELDEFTKTLKL